VEGAVEIARTVHQQQQVGVGGGVSSIRHPANCGRCVRAPRRRGRAYNESHGPPPVPSVAAAAPSRGWRPRAPSALAQSPSPSLAQPAARRRPAPRRRDRRPSWWLRRLRRRAACARSRPCSAA
jgi:hypothetical protein